MKRAIFTTLFVVCAALPALSAELEFSAGGEVEYDDNVFRTNEDKEDDVLFRLRPGVRIYEDRGDDLNFSARVRGSDRVLGRQRLRLRRSRSHRRRPLPLPRERPPRAVRQRPLRLHPQHAAPSRAWIPIVLEEGFPQFNDERDRIKINDASLGAIYHFSPRTTGRLSRELDLLRQLAQRPRAGLVGGGQRPTRSTSSR